MLRSKPLFASDNVTYLFLESVLISAAIWLGYEIRFSFPGNYGKALVERFIPIIVAVAVLQTTLYYNGLYEKKPYSPIEVIFKLQFSLLIAAGCLTVCYYLFPILSLGRGVFVISFGLCAVFLISARLIQIHLIGSGKIGQRIIILGTGDRAMHIARLISQKKGSGYTLLGFVESDEDWMSRKSRMAAGTKPVLTLMSDSHESPINFPEHDLNEGQKKFNQQKNDFMGITIQRKSLIELMKRLFRFRDRLRQNGGA